MSSPEAALPIYQLTCQLASLDPSPEMQQLFGALRGNQALIDRFVRVIEGTLGVADFFGQVAA